MTNQYAARCVECGARVPRAAGVLSKEEGRLVVRHPACRNDSPDSVMEIRMGDSTFIRNTAGRCEDAPCCGCCTI